MGCSKDTQRGKASSHYSPHGERNVLSTYPVPAPLLRSVFFLCAKTTRQPPPYSKPCFSGWNTGQHRYFTGLVVEGSGSIHRAGQMEGCVLPAGRAWDGLGGYGAANVG